MERKQIKLDDLKGKNPFRMPDGYMDALTEQVTSQLPEKEPSIPVQVSLKEKVLPWLYLAAVFVGMMLFFPYVLEKGTPVGSKGAMAKAQQTVAKTAEEELLATEDEEYMDFMEEVYVDLLLSDEYVLLEE